MSTATAISSARPAVQAFQRAVSKPFLNSTFQPHPRPLNCCSKPATILIACDPSHPLHIKIKRRLAAFDPKKLNWAVYIPVDLSKQRVVRNWVARRIHAAFVNELQKRGLDSEGRVIGGSGMGTSCTPICGALNIRINPGRGASAIQATGNEVQMECSRLLAHVERTLGSRQLEGGRISAPRYRTKGADLTKA